ncbi:MAG: T9SS type A sorting domain-containing protein, partial [Flavobacteriales bacterium]|nr:T9SS type A sorting domain-containing protein [Flavobacteriales bacterium]
ASGNAAIYHGIITGISSGSYVCSGDYIADPSKDFGYPNIAHIGTTASTSEYIVSFEYVSPVDSAGTACVYYDGTDYSNLNIIHEGEGTLDRLFGTQERWGDYSGIHKKYNQPCSVWSCGTFARNDDSYGVWISEIRTQTAACNSSVGIEEPTTTLNALKLFPNPSVDFVELNFNMENAGTALIRIFDLNGKLIEELYNGSAKQGQNLLSFSVYHLNSGQYQLSIVTDQSEIASRSFIKL